MTNATNGISSNAERSCQQCAIVLMVFGPVIGIQFLLNIIAWLYCQRKRIKAYRKRKKPIVVKRLSSQEKNNLSKDEKESGDAFYINPHAHSNNVLQLPEIPDMVYRGMSPSIGGYSSISPYDYLQLTNSVTSATPSILRSRTSTLNSNRLLEEESPTKRRREYTIGPSYPPPKPPVRVTRSLNALIEESPLRNKGSLASRQRTTTMPVRDYFNRRLPTTPMTQGRATFALADMDDPYNYPRTVNYKTTMNTLNSKDANIVEEYIFDKDNVYLRPTTPVADDVLDRKDGPYYDEKDSDIYITMEMNSIKSGSPVKKSDIYAVVNKTKERQNSYDNARRSNKWKTLRRSSGKRKDEAYMWHTLPKEPFRTVKKKSLKKHRFHDTMFTRNHEVDKRSRVFDNFMFTQNCRQNGGMPIKQFPHENSLQKNSFPRNQNNCERYKENSDYETIPYNAAAEKSFQREQKFKSLLADLDGIINYDESSS